MVVPCLFSSCSKAIADRMPDLFPQAWLDLQAMSGWEVVAVVLAIAYLVLAIFERIECWYAAFFSTLIFIFLFWDASLLMESALNVYYLLMAVYGWLQWRGYLNKSTQTKIHLWPLRNHVLAIGVIFILAAVTGTMLAKNTEAAFPYLDSFTTWAAVVTTFMVARKVLENWWYWLVVNPISVFLYVERGLVLTALLYVAYVVMSVYGLLKWRQRYRLQQVT